MASELLYLCLKFIGLQMGLVAFTVLPGGLPLLLLALPVLELPLAPGHLPREQTCSCQQMFREWKSGLVHIRLNE